MNKALVTLGVLLITVLAVLFAAPAVIDWSRYRGSFEDQASSLLGRRVRVGDQVQLRLLPTPYISFDNVRVADATGRFDTPLLRMESFRLQLSVSSLLSGNFVAQDVELRAPILRLAIGRDGRGNWAGLLPGAKTAAAGPRRTAGLAIGKVHVTHGAVELVGAAEGQQWRLEDISGDVDAGGPDGPFRFKGGFAKDGKVTDLRLSVGRDDIAAKLRLKASTHAPDASSASYAFDGTLDGLDNLPTLSGDLEGKLPFPAPAQPPAGLPIAGLDLKAKLTATAEQATLDDIELVVDAPGRPQRVTGTASIGLTAEALSQAALKSTWLDLDQIAAGVIGAADTAAPKPTPLDSLRGLLSLASGLPEVAGNGRIQIAIEETRFGGARVDNLQAALNRTGDGMHIETLQAKLPGQSLVTASGDLNSLGALHFDGNVRLWGTNLAAMANWAVPSLRLSEAGLPSTYLIDSTVSADAARFSAEKMRAEVSGTTLTGAIRFVAAPQSLSILLDSDRLDLARQFDLPINLAALIGLTGAGADDPATASAAPGLSLKSLFSGDTYLDFRIGRLITAQGALHDVSAKLDRRNGRLNIPAIDVATDEGFTLHLEGALQVRDEQGAGQLRMLLGAPNMAAAASAVRIAGLPDMPTNLRLPIEALTPLSLAGTVEFGGRSSTSEGLALDGSAAGSHVSLQLHRDAGDGDWLSGQLDAAADLSHPDAARLLEQVARGLGATLSLTGAQPAPVASAGQTAAPALAGVLTLRLSGIPEDGLATRLDFNTGAVNASFDGRTSYAAGSMLGADGALGIEAKSATTVLQLTGLGRFVPDQPGELKLSGHLHRDAKSFGLTEATALIGGAPSSGEVTLLTQSPLSKLQATVQTSSLRLDHWLGMLAPKLATQSVQNPTGSEVAGSSAWSDRGFDFGLTNGLEASLKASTTRLVLSDGYGLTDAHLTVESRPGKVTIALDAGRALQGDWSGRLQLERAAAGAELHLDSALTKARLDQLSGPKGGLPRPEGELALKLSLDSKGLTPHDLASAASGKGSFELSEGALAGFSSNSIDAVARSALVEPTAPPNDILSQRLADISRTGAFAFRGANGALSIADGAIRFDKMRVDSAQSQLEIANRIDLAKLRLTSTWRLQPKPAQSDKTALPAVPFNFTGALADLTTVQPAIEIADLQRDLEARRLLGEPEQSQGIWPVEVTTSQGPEAAIAPPVPAPVAAAPAIVQSAGLPLAPTTPDAQAMASTSPVPQLATPSDTTVAANAHSQPAADAAGQVPAAKHAPPRPRKKKAGWASIFQGLFGN